VKKCIDFVQCKSKKAKQHHLQIKYTVYLNCLVVSILGIRARGSEFYSWVMLLFHWVATLGQLFTHIASPVQNGFSALK